MSRHLHGDYLTVDEYRALHGYSSCSTITIAIQQGRLEAQRMGKRTYIIHKNALITDNRIKSGKYIGKSQRYRAARLRREQQAQD